MSTFPTSAGWPRNCSQCRKRTRFLGDGCCSACWEPRGREQYPVQCASEPDEQSVLENRYRAVAVGDETLERFERAVRERSVAVVAMRWRIFQELQDDDRLIYTTYSGQTGIHGRRVARPFDDADRREVDYLLWGTSGEEVRTAALSLNGMGLKSYGYGEVYVTLDEICIAYRSVVLEEGAYHFKERHQIQRAEDRPKGRLALWLDRGRLAAVKHAADLTVGMPDEAFAGVLLRSEGNRETDRYMEVAIYGGFNRDALIYPPQFDDKFADPNWRNQEARRLDDILLLAAEQKKKRGKRDG